MASRRGQGGRKSRPEQTALRTSERLLIEAMQRLPGRRILCALSPQCQVAVAVAEMRPDARVVCHFLDANAAEFARSTQAAGVPNLEIVCGADLPEQPFDLFLLPFPAHGDTELARELLEQGASRLVSSGLVGAGADSTSESHLRSEMKKLFERPSGYSVEEGVVYVAGPTLKAKRRDFSDEFAVRDGERLVKAVSRPGLWNHRGLVGSIRPLLNSMVIQPGERVLNPGCDAGVLALAAAMRAEGVEVVAVDSNTRAVECTRRGAELNGLGNVSVHLASGRWSQQRGSFDVVIACPPYISNARLADVYIDGSYEALKPGGRIAFSSKQRVWYADELSRGFEQIEVAEVREHNVITARKKS